MQLQKNIDLIAEYPTCNIPAGMLWFLATGYSEGIIRGGPACLIILPRYFPANGEENFFILDMNLLTNVNYMRYIKSPNQRFSALVNLQFEFLRGANGTEKGRQDPYCR